MDIGVLQERLQRAVGEEFTVGPLLGQGGFAAVFRCKDVALGRDVAIKVLDLDLAPSPTLAERFVREAQVIAQLEHPNIVPIHKVGRRRDVLFLVMRCVDGPSLRQLLANNRRLSVGDAARIARQVADALGYAHSESIVHRDIKPDNILIDHKTGVVLVTDFGIAKAAQAAQVGGSQLTTEGMVIGTPQYMSPEQAAGDRVDGRSDVYSLGIVLYQMLAGEPPFDGDSSASILAQQLTAAPPPLRRARGDVPPELADIVGRMLEKEAGRRFQNAADVSRALVGALPTAAKNRVKAPLGRRLLSLGMKTLVSVGVGGCLLSVAFAAGVLVMGWAESGRPPRIAAAAPVPDTLLEALRRRGALARGDTAVFAFQPDEPGDSALLVVGRRQVAILSTAVPQRYARAAVLGSSTGLRWVDGPHFVVTLRVKARSGVRRDTVYRALPLRAYWEYIKRIGRALPDSGSGSRVRVRLEPGRRTRLRVR
jgi:Protein kinase domain